jgi:hypothetical protein
MISREKWLSISDEQRKIDLKGKLAKQKNETVGVYVTPGAGTKDIPKFLFLANDMATLMVISAQIKKQLVKVDSGFSADSALFLFMGGTVPSMTDTVGALLAENQKPDGFLHITYTKENVFGHD